MPISRTSESFVFITMGDPSGVGPEVVLKSVASPEISGLAIFVIVADIGVLEDAPGNDLIKNAARYRLKKAKDDLRLGKLKEKEINIIDPGQPLKKVVPGAPTREGAKKALDCLNTSVGLMKSLPNASLVTAPVSKELIASVRPGFTGHTEYLRDAYFKKNVTMVMTGEKLNVALVTRHIPLKEVALSLSGALIADTLRHVIDNRVLISGKENARIGVSGLNPHCGEKGIIGDEEERIIEPAIRKMKDFYAKIEGPVPADIIFYKAMKKELDIVVAMYHDQGLAAFKMVEFKTGVNLTLGLDHIRTSPDHGTAFDIAGKDMADPSSMKAAIKLACRAAIRE